MWGSSCPPANVEASAPEKIRNEDLWRVSGRFRKISERVGPMDEMILCTGNQGKVAELRAMMGGLSLKTLEDLGFPAELPETGDSLESNALEKARFVFERCGIPSLADDSGLEVYTLGGAPGVRSARFAGPAKDPQANMKLLMEKLEGRNDRRARFRTVLALVTAEGEFLFEGVVEGRIAEAPRGAGGFGYDPVFVPEHHDKTFAEMDAAEKNVISHRGRAIRLLVDHLAR